MTTYRLAPEVAVIAGELIRDVEQHAALKDVELRYVWRDKASKSKDRLVLAKARKVGGLNAFLAQTETADTEMAANDPMFVVEVAEDTWLLLDDHQRVALIDHELCHLNVDFDGDGEPVLSIRGHDLEEFACIVRRRGLWKSDVATFGAEVAQQLALAIEDAERFLREPEEDA